MSGNSKHKKLNNMSIVIVSIVAFIIIIAVFGENEDTETKSTTTNVTKVFKEKEIKTKNKFELDALQQLYVNINSKMTYKEMIKLVKSTKLPYSEEKYNGSRTIQVAFTDGCTAQRYKKESGDYLTIDYLYPSDENSSNDELDKYYFGTCCYVPNDSSLELIEHCSGQYFNYTKKGNCISDLGTTLDIDSTMSKSEQMNYYFENK